MFDPMHNGHLDLIERSLRIFDELIVAVVAKPSKQPLFEVKERLEMIDEATAGMGRMRIPAFDGLRIDLAHREQADCIVRGIRAVSDFEYEFQMALMNRKLRHTVETVFMMPHEKYTYISSRLIKEVASLGAPIAPHQGGRFAGPPHRGHAPPAGGGAARPEILQKVGRPCSLTG